MSIVKWVLHKGIFLEATPTDDHFQMTTLKSLKAIKLQIKERNHENKTTG